VSAPREYYDEVFDERGDVRPPYRAAVRFLRGFSRKFLAGFPDASRRLTEDMPLTAMPRILSQSEYELLARGTAQRAHALRAFYEDYLGAQTFRDQVIPGRILDLIVERTADGAFRRFLCEPARGRLRAFFGPDIVRGKDGRFYALEDNLHFLGGMGDLEPARAVHEKLLPGFARAIEATNEPRAFLDALVARFHEVADPPIGPGPDQGAFVVFGTPPYGDEEDHRLYRMLEARHAVIVEPGMKDRKITVEPDGAYLIQKVRVGNTSLTYKKKIGFLWMNAEHIWVDWEHPAIREKALLDEAREQLGHKATDRRSSKRIRAAMRRDPVSGEIDLRRLKRAIRKSNLEFEDSVLGKPLIPGLMDLILRGKAQTNATPGIGFMDDKMFYTYVPELIRFYLKEDPILENVPTYRLFELDEKGEVTPRAAFIVHVMSHRERYVIKVVDGRGGKGVHLGPRMTERKWRRLEKRLLAEPTRYEVQEFTHPSVLSDPRGNDRRIADSRLIAMIIDDQVLVAGTFWGRCNVLSGGDGKVNLSRSGMETVGYIVPDAAGVTPSG
jgi:uncharacterized circularly permuted ATP-grasp superfamily protein